MNMQHPDLSLDDYSLLFDSMEWEIDAFEQAGWTDTPRFDNLLRVQQAIHKFLRKHHDDYPH